MGNIRLTSEANQSDGFDQNWLQNALYEPLDEADMDVEEECHKRAQRLKRISMLFS